MLQDFLPGFPEGAIQINPRVRLLKKEGVFTYFVGTDNYLSHMEREPGAFRMSIATLIRNGHVRPVEVELSPLGIPHRTLMRWSRQLDEEGSDSFFTPRRTRGSGILTPEKICECQGFFAEGYTVAEVARLACVNESTLRKAVAGGRVERKRLNFRPTPDQADSKSQRSRKDAEAAEGMGTACTRADEHEAAAMGMAGHAKTRFEPCDDVVYGGLLEQVPGQPDEAQLAADPLLHRFVVIFDREGANHSLLSALWEKRIGAITYRKSVENVWPEAELGEVEVTHPSGERTTINVPNQFPSRSGSLNFER